MPKKVKELTDISVRNAKPDETKNKTLFDGKGLFLLISPKGEKGWRFKYLRFNGKTNIISFGAYPDISLGDARAKRDIARKQLDAGIDPSDARKAVKGQVTEDLRTLEVVAREWHGKQTWSERHAADVMGKLENDVFPVVGSVPMATLKTLHCLKVIKAVEGRGALETAHRIRQNLVAICGYALANEYAESNVAALTKGALTHLGRQNIIRRLLTQRNWLGFSGPLTLIRLRL